MSNARITQTLFVRNHREIARALRLKSTRKQLAEIGEWISRPDFPTKQGAKGWPREDVVKWAAGFATEMARLSVFKTVMQSDRKPSSRDLAVLKSIAAGGNGEVPTHAENQVAIAEIIAKTFGVRCQRQDIQKWRKARPPFPAADDAGRYLVSACLDWYRTNKSAHGPNGSSDLFERAATAEKTREIRELEKFEWQWEVERGQFVKKTDHNRILSGLGKEVRARIVQYFERDQPARRDRFLRDLGLSDEQRRRFAEFDRRETDAAVDALFTALAGKVTELNAA